MYMDCTQEHDRNALRRQQLVEIDQSGMTLTMIAARSGNVAILGATLGIIDHVQVGFWRSDPAHGHRRC